MPDKNTNDPYSDWLDIPEGIRPPYPHTLLGVPEGTQDADVIKAAAQGQIDKLQVYGIDSDPKTQTIYSRLINEIKQAEKELLLDIQSQTSTQNTKEDDELNDPTDSRNGLSDSAITDLISLQSADGNDDSDAHDPASAIYTESTPSPAKKSKSADKLSIILLSLLVGAVVGAIVTAIVLTLTTNITSPSSPNNNSTTATSQSGNNSSQKLLTLKNNQLQSELGKAQNHSQELNSQIKTLKKQIAKLKSANLKKVSHNHSGSTNSGPKTVRHINKRIPVATLLKPLIKQGAKGQLSSSRRNMLAVTMLDQAVIRLKATEKIKDDSKDKNSIDYPYAILEGNIAQEYRTAGDTKSSRKILAPLYDSAKNLISAIAKNLDKYTKNNNDSTPSNLIAHLLSDSKQNTNLSDLQKIMPSLAGSIYAKDAVRYTSHIKNALVQRTILKEVLTYLAGSQNYAKTIPASLLVYAAKTLPKDNQDGVAEWMLPLILKNADNYDNFADAKKVVKALSNANQKLIGYSKIARAQAEVTNFTEAANTIENAKKDLFDSASDSAKLLFVSSNAVVYAKAKQTDSSQKAIKQAQQILENNIGNTSLGNFERVKSLRNLAIASMLIGDKSGAEASWVNAIKILKQPYSFQPDTKVKYFSKIIADQLIYGTKAEAYTTIKIVDVQYQDKIYKNLIDNFIERGKLSYASRYVLNVADDNMRLSLLINILNKEASNSNKDDELLVNHLLSQAVSLSRKSQIESDLKDQMAATLIYNHNIEQAVNYISRMKLDNLSYAIKAFAETNHPYMAAYYLSKITNDTLKGSSIEMAYQSTGKTRQFSLLSSLQKSTISSGDQAYALTGLTEGLLKNKTNAADTKSLSGNAKQLLTSAKLIP